MQYKYQFINTSFLYQNIGISYLYILQISRCNCVPPSMTKQNKILKMEVMLMMKCITKCLQVILPFLQRIEAFKSVLTVFLFKICITQY
jgi:hypothetical protein